LPVEGALPGLHAISSRLRAGMPPVLRGDAEAKGCWERSIDNERRVSAQLA
jgi:hypothetical protein